MRFSAPASRTANRTPWFSEKSQWLATQTNCIMTTDDKTVSVLQVPKILFKCRSCGNQLVRDDVRAGMPVHCPKCGSSLTVPKTTIVYTCPHSDCSRAVKIDVTLKGDGLQCPSCNKPMMLPIQRADRIVFLCKRCEKIVEIPVAAAGKLLPCPKCDAFIRGPELQATADAMTASLAPGPASPAETGGGVMTANDQILPILVVDDNHVDQHLMAVHLKQIRSFKRGIEIDFARDGAEALAKLRLRDFALVVLDWNLPVAGQGEVLRHLRNTGSRMPVVVVSGVGQQHLADELTALQGTFLSKDTMSPQTFHIAICMALALVKLNVAHFFETQSGKTG